MSEQPEYLVKDYWKQRVRPKLDLIEGWARNGLSNSQIALNLGISDQTLRKYVKIHPELADILDLGRQHAEIVVENALFKRAIGYQFKEVTKERVRDPETGEVEFVVTKSVTKYQAPDTSAAVYWLENRAPKRWARNPVSMVDADAVSAGIKSLAELLMSPVKEREKND